MKRISAIIIALMFSVSSYAEYNIGEVCNDVSWTDDSGLSTSIYDQIDQGKVVMLFFGQSW